jgi:hypothetical protein
MVRRKWIFIVFGVLSLVAGSNYIYAEELRQVVVSPTPAPINLPSPLPFSTDVLSTATLTRTPTAPGPALLEAINEANVRAQPDTESERLGTIRPGETYPIIGRYFRWYQFQFAQSPTGTGWVFDELVRIIGDETAIRDLAEEALPTTDTTAVGLTGTMEAITQTPGGILTATASAQFIPLPIEGATSSMPLDSVLEGEATLLPTFTFPPEVALLPPENAYQAGSMLNGTPTLAPDQTGIVVMEGFPPIVPILLLAGFGILGLLITTRR